MSDKVGVAAQAAQKKVWELESPHLQCVSAKAVVKLA